MFKRYVISIIGFFFIQVAFAANESPQSFTLDGQLYDSTAMNTPLTDPNVTFTIQIFNPSGNCLLYEETQAPVGGVTDGFFNLQVGSSTGAGKRSGDDPNLTMAAIYQNKSQVRAPGGASCAGGYTPTAGHTRVVRITVLASTIGTPEVFADMTLDSVPNAIVAQSVQGLERDNMLEINKNAQMTQGNFENVFGVTNYPKLTGLLSGTMPSSGGVISANTQRISNVSNPTSGTDAANKNYADGFIGGKAADTAGMSGLGGGDAGKVMVWDGTKWAAAASSGDATKLPLNGTGTMTGSLQMGNQNITGAGHILQIAQAYHKLGAFTDGQELTLTGGLTNTAADIGKAWYNTDDFQYKIWNGTAAVPVANLDPVTNKIPSSLMPTNAILNGGNTTGAAVVVGTNDNQSLQFETNDSVAMTILNNGRVGIGQATPAAQLHVEGPALSESFPAYKAVYTGGATAYLTPRASDVLMGSYSNHNLFIATNNQTRVQVNANGNVGIGVAPTLKTEIMGPIGQPASAGSTQTGVLRISQTSSQSVMDMGVYNGGATWIQATNSANLSNNYIIGLNPNGGQVAVGTVTPSTGTRFDVRSGAIGAGSIGAGAGGGGEVRFYEAGAPGTNYVGFKSPDALAADLVWTLPAANGPNGSVLTWSTGNVLSWSAPAANLASINGDTTAAQTIQTGNAGTDFAINTAAGVHTINIPSSNATNRGLLTSGDWTTFNGKLGAVSNTANLATNKVWIGDAGGRAQEQSIIGDASLVANGTLTIANNAIGSAEITDGSIATADLFTNPGINYLVMTDGSTGAALVSKGCNNTEILQWATATGWGCVAPNNLVSLSGLTAAAGSNTINNTNLAQTWNWNSLSTQTAMTMASSSLTTGNVLSLVGSNDNVASTGNILKVTSSGTSSAAIPMMITNEGTGLSLRINDDGTDADTTPFVVNASGSVGIGTTGPSYLLTVQHSNVVSGTLLSVQDANPNGWIRLSDLSNTTNWFRPEIELKSRGGGVGFDYARIVSTLENGRDEATSNAMIFNSRKESGTLTAANLFQWQSNGSPLMTMSPTGNVGIGTSSPTVSLDLNSRTDAIRVPAGTTAEQPGTPGNGMIRYNTSNNKLEAYENGGWTNMIGGGAATTVAAVNGAVNTPSMSFANDPDTGFYSPGNNSNTISVSTGNSNIFNFSSAGMVSSTNGGGVVTTAAGAQGAPTFSFKNDEDTGWWNPAANTLAASTGGFERVRIDSSGNVGIGTTTPNNDLDVRRVDTDAELYLRAVTSAGAPKIYGARANSSAGSPSAVTNGNYLLSLIGDGYTGAGWSSGLAEINMVATENWNGTANGTGISFRTTANTTTTTSEKMFIEGDGDVGIGTGSPAERLHVAKDVDGDTYIRISNSNSGSGAEVGVELRTDAGAIGWLFAGSSSFSTTRWRNRLGLHTNSSNGDGIDIVSAKGTGDIRMYTGGNGTSEERVRVLAGGNVGIGTNDPKAKLDVSGDVKIGNSSATCDSTTAGSVRYTAGIMELCNGTSWRTVGRETLTANRTYYVRTDGSDANTGLANTAGGAFLTIQKAINVIYGTLDIATYTVTIQLGDGTYTGNVQVNGPFVGAGTVLLKGNAGTPANTIISTASATVEVRNNAVLKIESIELRSSTNICLTARDGGMLLGGSGMRFGTCVGAHMKTQSHGRISFEGVSFSIVGDTSTGIWSISQGYASFYGSTITMVGTPDFASAHASANFMGFISFENVTFNGTGATGKRYDSRLNSVIYTNGGGASFIPGNSAGTTATGGQYN